MLADMADGHDCDRGMKHLQVSGAALLADASLEALLWRDDVRKFAALRICVKPVIHVQRVVRACAPNEIAVFKVSR